MDLKCGKNEAQIRFIKAIYNDRKGYRMATLAADCRVSRFAYPIERPARSPETYQVAWRTLVSVGRGQQVVRLLGCLCCLLAFGLVPWLVVPGRRSTIRIYSLVVK